MIQVDIKSTSDQKNLPAALVVVVRKNGKKTEAIGANKDIAGLLDAAFDDGLEFGDLKKGLFLRGQGPAPIRHVLFISFDSKKKDLEEVRRFAPIVYQHLKAQKVASAAIPLDSLAQGLGKPAEVAAAFTEGALLAAYNFDTYKTKKKKEGSAPEFKVERLELLITKKNNPKLISKAIDDATKLIACVNFARTLGNVPGNLMTPEILANETVAAAKGTKLKVTVWDKARIEKEKFGGLLGVSLGSAVEPRFIIMEYKGGAKTKKPVCFVGKGLTFDSGGISIKPSGGMEEMKYDKCGGANVIGTMLAIARLGLKVNAIGLVPATENMPGPLANKPGDILVARNGKTVEVDNTDAEGRVILMDALSYATELQPAAIFDAATLTGACVVALGNSYTGCFTRSEKVRRLVNAAAEASGEMVWQMPIHDHHVEDMKGTYADLNNISSFKGAGASTAAAYLEQFVDKDIPWAHFDIAGTAWHVGNRLNYCARKGASGVMVRTFVELAKTFV